MALLIAILLTVSTSSSLSSSTSNQQAEYSTAIAPSYSSVEVDVTSELEAFTATSNYNVQFSTNLVSIEKLSSSFHELPSPYTSVYSDFASSTAYLITNIKSSSDIDEVAPSSQIPSIGYTLSSIDQVESGKESMVYSTTVPHVTTEKPHIISTVLSSFTSLESTAAPPTTSMVHSSSSQDNQISSMPLVTIIQPQSSTSQMSFPSSSSANLKVSSSPIPVLPTSSIEDLSTKSLSSLVEHIPTSISIIPAVSIKSIGPGRLSLALCLSKN